MSKETRVASQYKPLGEAIGFQPFHPEMPQRKFDDLVEQVYMGTLFEARIVNDFHTKFGVRPAAFLLIGDDKPEFTSISSNQVVVDQAKQALAKKALPASILIHKVELDSGQYYYTLTE